jgi:hypothetical protein
MVGAGLFFGTLAKVSTIAKWKLCHAVPVFRCLMCLSESISS